MTSCSKTTFHRHPGATEPRDAQWVRLHITPLFLSLSPRASIFHPNIETSSLSSVINCDHIVIDGQGNSMISPLFAAITRNGQTKETNMLNFERYKGLFPTSSSSLHILGVRRKSRQGNFDFWQHYSVWVFWGVLSDSSTFSTLVMVGCLKLKWWNSGPTGGECGEAAPRSLLSLLLQSRSSSLGLGTRLPQRQREVVGGHPGGTQQRHHVQTQRQEDAQQCDQLEGPEHVHFVHGHLLFSALLLSSCFSLNVKKQKTKNKPNKPGRERRHETRWRSTGVLAHHWPLHSLCCVECVKPVGCVRCTSGESILFKIRCLLLLVFLFIYFFYIKEERIILKVKSARSLFTSPVRKNLFYSLRMKLDDVLI